jgi:MFS transporter, PPP family, 3-phenylpropionic acid transporter
MRNSMPKQYTIWTASHVGRRLPSSQPSWPIRNSALVSFITLFSALYIAYGITSPFLPAFFSSRGLGPEQIGFVLSLSAIMRLFSGPIAGRIADRLHALRRIFAICTAAAAVLASTLVVAFGFFPLLVVSLMHAAMLAPAPTLADALALRARSESHARVEYGCVRGAGSAAFFVGAVISGQVVNILGFGSALVAQAVFLAGAARAAFLVPEIRVVRERSGYGPLPGFSLLLRNQMFRRLVLVAAIIVGSHAMQDAFAMIAWNAAEISPAVGSLLWSESVAAEVLVFFILGPWLLRRIRPEMAMVMSAIAATLRWTVMSQTPSVFVLSFIQPLHGLTFALLHLACMRVLVIITPVELAATAQALYAFGIGTSFALLTLASGFLYARFSAAGFLVMAALALVSLPAIWGLSRSLDRVHEVRP